MGPALVLTFAVKPTFSACVKRQLLPLNPFLCRMYNMSSMLARSYAFFTSKKEMSRCLPSIFARAIMFLRMKIWSVGEAPFWPPAWACENLIVFMMLLFSTSSGIVQMELETVIPRWFPIHSRSPFPFHMLVMIPRLNWEGASSSSQNAFITGMIRSTMGSPPFFSKMFFQSVVAFLSFFFWMISFISSLLGIASLLGVIMEGMLLLSLSLITVSWTSLWYG